ncbi:probable starch synthase 4, chloroplastic/amyloplastic isoform X1 [Tanacetum coccineum]|uniref:Probable starch synthase 4, chloroplastic/amyloplastic isoform X1 n=1 Tax=Tanacetum coccineum TaxID=301880 RepID=A0ABQ5F6L1_9ASTR
MERLELLDEEEHILGMRIVGGDHRLRGYNGAFDRAFKDYLSDSEGWEELMHKVMSIDFSWNTLAPQYEELYQQSMAKASAARRAAG